MQLSHYVGGLQRCGYEWALYMALLTFLVEDKESWDVVTDAQLIKYLINDLHIPKYKIKHIDQRIAEITWPLVSPTFFYNLGPLFVLFFS